MEKLEGNTIWYRLRKRLGIVDIGTAAPRYVAEFVQPVTNVDEVLVEDDIRVVGSVDISGVSGYVPFHEVPVGERWWLVAYQSSLITGSTAVEIHESSSASSSGYAIDDVAAGGHNGVLNTPVPMDEGWSVGMIKTNNGADASEALVIHVRKVKAY